MPLQNSLQAQASLNKSMAISKLNTLPIIRLQTPLPTKNPQPPQLPLFPSQNPSTLRLKTQLMILDFHPKFPLNTSINEEEESHPRYQHWENSNSLSVIFPSLAFSNTLFFKSHYNVEVIVQDNEPEENLISNFRRAVLKARVIQECKRRRFFESNQEKRKRKTREAAKRYRKRRTQPKVSKPVKAETSKKKKQDLDDDNDNWEFFDVDLPYC